MHMIELWLRSDRLVGHAQAQGHNQPHDEDLGYATHAWLRATLGDLAPSSFRLLEARDGRVRLLGYAPADAASLREHAETFASPGAVEVCNWSEVSSKGMHDIPWRAGQRLGFEVRVCPVVRSDHGERDAFLASLPTLGADAEKRRGEVYCNWLCRQFGTGATVAADEVRMKAFRLVSTWRRAHRSEPGRGRRVVRPDALMTGRCSVAEPEAFRRLLARGIGRHRAFGFGMLLVRPE